LIASTETGNKSVRRCKKNYMNTRNRPEKLTNFIPNLDRPEEPYLTYNSAAKCVFSTFNFCWPAAVLRSRCFVNRTIQSENNGV